MAMVCLVWNLIEKFCFHGTRFVVWFGGFYVFLHFLLAVVDIKYIYWPLINASIFTICFIWWYIRWLQFGESDMKSLQTHGPFKPGMKRFKSDHGNDCMAFYPVNKDEISFEIDAYCNKELTK